MPLPLGEQGEGVPGSGSGSVQARRYETVGPGQIQRLICF